MELLTHDLWSRLGRFLPSPALAMIQKASSHHNEIIWCHATYHLSYKVDRDNKTKPLPSLLPLIHHKHAAKMLKNIQDIKFPIRFADSNDHLSHLSNFGNLRNLTIGANALNNSGIAHLSALTSLRHLCISDSPEVIESGLNPLTACTNLASLDLSNLRRLDGTSLAGFSALTNLTTLDCFYCELLPDEAIHDLKMNTKLQNLKLWRTKITDAGMETLQYLTGLVDLNLNRCHALTDKGMIFLSYLTNLVELEIQDCQDITDNGLAYIRSLNLKNLNISECTSLSQAFEIITTMTNLKCLVVEETKVDIGLHLLQGLSNLKILRLSGWKPPPKTQGHQTLHEPIVLPKLKDIDISYTINFQGLDWAFLPNLRRLSAQSSDLGDEFCRELTGLSQLEDLDMSSCPITDDALISIGKLISLAYLRLSSCDSVTSAGIQHLTSLTNLNTLGLAKTRMSSEAAQYFPSMVALTSLDLTKSDIGDEIVPYMLECPKLKSLCISDCTALTPDVIEILKSRIENVDSESKPWYY